MAADRFGYISIIILQQIAIIGLFWAMTRVLERVRRVRHATDRQIHMVALDLEHARREEPHPRSGAPVSLPPIEKKARAFSAAAG